MAGSQAWQSSPGGHACSRSARIGIHAPASGVAQTLQLRMVALYFVSGRQYDFLDSTTARGVLLGVGFGRACASEKKVELTLLSRILCGH